MTSSELFAAMSPGLATDIFEFTQASEKEFFRAALDAVAKMRKVRPVFLERQPRAERYTALQESLGRPAMSFVADSLLRAWLLKKQAGLLSDFLDALKIPHKDGVVEDLPATVSDAEINNAVEQLLLKHSVEVTAVYLNAFNSMNDAKWETLDLILKTDPRLQLGAS